MWIRLDTASLQQHMDIVYQEERTARRLLERIDRWKQEAMLIPGTDLSEILWHRDFVQGEMRNIRRRMELLESMKERLHLSVRRSQSLMEETIGQMNRVSRLLQDGDDLW